MKSFIVDADTMKKHFPDGPRLPSKMLVLAETPFIVVLKTDTGTLTVKPEDGKHGRDFDGRYIMVSVAPGKGFARPMGSTDSLKLADTYARHWGRGAHRGNRCDVLDQKTGKTIQSYESKW